MSESGWLENRSPAFRLMIATSWLAPDAWKKVQEEAICDAICSGANWTEYLAQVARHGTPALSWAALSRVPGLTIPQFAKEELKSRSDACRIEAVTQCLLIAEVLKTFNREGIAAMPFKGQVLSFGLYGDVGLRFSKDLDVAVAAEDLDRARATLEDMGWRLDASTWFPLSPRQWNSFFRHEHHLDFNHHRAGRRFELHWRSQWETPELTKIRWARSTVTSWQGCSIRTMSSCDLALYLCSHGGHHAWFRAKWLGDFARLHASGKLDWEEVLNDARKTGQDELLMATLVLLEQLYGLPVPAIAADACARLPKILIETPLKALEGPEPEGKGKKVSIGSIRRRLRMNDYEKLLPPGETWIDSLSRLLYRRENFRTFPLPDFLFWAYAPLHPVLWIWRWVRQPSRSLMKFSWNGRKFRDV